MEPATGLLADIFKYKGKSYANRGISTRVDDVTVIVPGQSVGPFPVKDDRPAVVIKRRAATLRQAEYVYAEPLEPVPAGEIGYMMGGCYVGSSDSRFVELTGGLSAVPLHDRTETPSEYRAYSA